MTQLVLTQQRNHIFEIVLNRPDKRNAINMELFRQFDTAVTQANRTPGLRAVLIRGEGKAFSAGIDVSSLLGLAGLAPGSKVQMVITHSDGTTDAAVLNHTFSPNQIEWFKAGSALNQIRAMRA